MEDPDRLLAAAEKLARLGETKQAEGMIRDLLWAFPEHPEAHYRYARLLRDEQRLFDAERAYRVAIDLDPRAVSPVVELVDLLRASGRHEEAFGIAAKLSLGELPAEAALAIRELWADAADFLKADEAGDPLDLVEQLAEGVRGRAFSLPSLLAAADTPERIRRLNACIRDWARAKSIEASILPIEHPPRLRNGILRLGLVCAAAPPTAAGRAADLALRLDRARISPELVVHGAADREARAGFAPIGKAFDRLMVTEETSPRALAELLAGRGYDVVIDLDGHGHGGSRLAALSWKPAGLHLLWPERPVPGGLAALAGTLCDAVLAAVPKGGAIEAPIPLEGPWLALEAMDDVEVEAEVASVRASFPVFATMAEPDWLRPQAIETWAAILQELPPARLLFFGPAYTVPTVRRNLIAAFEACGIGQRIDFAHAPASGIPELALWNMVDICLDSFPLSLGAKLAAPLHMGVPAVTWAGTSAWTRTGASVLTAAGLADLCTGSRDAYVEKVLDLTWDVARRRQLRQDLRGTLANGPLLDQDRLARQISDRLFELATAPT